MLHPRGLPDALAQCQRTLVMAVLNVTPDSFSDGGRFAEAVNSPAAHCGYVGHSGRNGRHGIYRFLSLQFFQGRLSGLRLLLQCLDLGLHAVVWAGAKRRLGLWLGRGFRL